MEKLAEKLAMAGHYALLSSHELERRGYGIVPPFKLDFTTIRLFRQDRTQLDETIWMARFDGLSWSARIGPVDAFFKYDYWWHGFGLDDKEWQYDVDAGLYKLTVQFGGNEALADQWVTKHQHDISHHYSKFLETYWLRRLLGLLGINMKPHQF